MQERGLYFADNWDDAYERRSSRCTTPASRARKGALLVAKHGKGAFVYTGLAFFRQLPAGVPGAYRLFANLLDYAPLSDRDDESRAPLLGTLARAGTPSCSATLAALIALFALTLSAHYR